ncbi:MAG: hypothetical protein OXB98_06750 [Bryobacterales bacterium]|nr:hypothetical protein [Bryobacterales bacterium]
MASTKQSSRKDVLKEVATINLDLVKTIVHSLGRASIQTTDRYLGLRQGLHDAPYDRFGLVGWEG